MTDYLGVDMSKSTKGKNPDHLTVEEAASILGMSQKDMQHHFFEGTLTKLRAPNGEVRVSKAQVERHQYIFGILADWPEPTEQQVRTMQRLLCPHGSFGPAPRTGPSEYELEQRRKMQEREDALKATQKAALSLTACDVCNLQPDVHHIRRAQRIDMHEWVPGRAEKVMNRG